MTEKELPMSLERFNQICSDLFYSNFNMNELSEVAKGSFEATKKRLLDWGWNIEAADLDNRLSELSANSELDAFCETVKLLANDKTFTDIKEAVVNQFGGPKFVKAIDILAAVIEYCSSKINPGTTEEIFAQCAKINPACTLDQVLDLLGEIHIAGCTVINGSYHAILSVGRALEEFISEATEMLSAAWGEENWHSIYPSSAEKPERSNSYNLYDYVQNKLLHENYNAIKSKSLQETMEKDLPVSLAEVNKYVANKTIPEIEDLASSGDLPLEIEEAVQRLVDDVLYDMDSITLTTNGKATKVENPYYIFADAAADAGMDPDDIELSEADDYINDYKVKAFQEIDGNIYVVLDCDKDDFYNNIVDSYN